MPIQKLLCPFFPYKVSVTQSIENVSKAKIFQSSYDPVNLIEMEDIFNRSGIFASEHPQYLDNDFRNSG